MRKLQRVHLAEGRQPTEPAHPPDPPSVLPAEPRPWLKPGVKLGGQCARRICLAAEAASARPAVLSNSDIPLSHCRDKNMRRPRSNPSLRVRRRARVTPPLSQAAPTLTGAAG